MPTIAYDQARKIRGVKTRLSRLDAAGVPLVTAGNLIVTSGLVEVTMTPEYDTGPDTVLKGADGQICFADKEPDLLKRMTAVMRFCYPDPIRDAFLAGGTVVTETVVADTFTTGYEAPAVGVDPNPNGVCVEVFARAKTAAGAPAVWRPFFVHRLGRAFFQLGVKTFNNDPDQPSYSGYSTENPNFGSGPGADWTGPTTNAYGWRRVAAVPADV